MATKYYVQTSNSYTTCDAGQDPHDLTTSTPSSSTSSGSTNSISFVEILAYDVYFASGMSTQTINCSIEASGISGASTEWKYRLQQVDPSGCSVTNSSSYSTTYTTTGIKTDSLSLTWTGSSGILRVSIEFRRTGSPVNPPRILDIAIDTNTWVEVTITGPHKFDITACELRITPWSGPAGGLTTISKVQTGMQPGILLPLLNGEATVTGNFYDHTATALGSVSDENNYIRERVANHDSATTYWSAPVNNPDSNMAEFSVESVSGAVPNLSFTQVQVVLVCRSYGVDCNLATKALIGSTVSTKNINSNSWPGGGSQEDWTTVTLTWTAATDHSGTPWTKSEVEAMTVKFQVDETAIGP